MIWSLAVEHSFQNKGHDFRVRDLLENPNATGTSVSLSTSKIKASIECPQAGVLVLSWLISPMITPAHCSKYPARFKLCSCRSMWYLYSSISSIKIIFPLVSSCVLLPKAAVNKDKFPPTSGPVAVS